MDITVLVTNYNYSRYLRRCIRSLLSQHYPRDKFEIIVVDDASTDDSVSRLTDYVDAGEIRLLKNKRNLGIGSSANIGVSHAGGKYIVRVDSDDYVQPEFLMVLFAACKHTNAIGATVDYRLVSDDDENLGMECWKDKKIACGLMMKTSYLESIGSYTRNIRLHEDRDLFSRVDFSRIVHIPIPLYNYVKHSDSLTSAERE